MCGYARILKSHALNSVGRTYEDMIPEIEHLVFFRERGKVWTAAFFLLYANNWEWGLS